MRKETEDEGGKTHAVQECIPRGEISEDSGIREVGRQNHACGNVSFDGRWRTVAEGTVPDNRYGDSIPRCAPCWDIRKRVHPVLRSERPVLRNKISLHAEEIENLRRDAVEYVDDNFRAKSFVTALTEQSEYEE